MPSSFRYVLDYLGTHMSNRDVWLGMPHPISDQPSYINTHCGIRDFVLIDPLLRASLSLSSSMIEASRLMSSNLITDQRLVVFLDSMSNGIEEVST